MVIKLIGAVLFLIGSIFLGKSIDETYKTRIKYWREILSFLTFCQTEITQFATPIEEIKKKYIENQTKNTGIFSDSIQYITNDKDEHGFLYGFLNEIKETDLSTHDKIFESYRKEAEKHLLDVETARNKKGKTYRKIVPLLCAGIVVVIW